MERRSAGGQWTVSRARRKHKNQHWGMRRSRINGNCGCKMKEGSRQMGDLIVRGNWVCFCVTQQRLALCPNCHVINKEPASHFTSLMECIHRCWQTLFTGPAPNEREAAVRLRWADRQMLQMSDRSWKKVMLEEFLSQWSVTSYSGAKKVFSLHLYSCQGG